MVVGYGWDTRRATDKSQGSINEMILKGETEGDDDYDDAHEHRALKMGAIS